MSSDNIKVAIRIRPLIQVEKERGLKIHWGVTENNIFQIDHNGQRIGEPYSFDHIFDMNKPNKTVYYEVVNKFVTATVEGLNATIFAYGQTSSGKTYTMFGTPDEPGITNLAIDNLFNSIESCKHRRFLVRVSFIEIYNEKINDLLEPNNKDIRIREDLSGNLNLKGAREEIVSNKDQIFEFMAMGSTNRRIAGTNMNERSSRSHTIFKIMVESTEINNDTPALTSNLNLVDLAGSERVAQTKATGVRLIEGGHINKSLSALGLVIRQLSDGQEFVNFRDSKLTRLLQHSLGGNSKTLIIGTVTPASTEDTHSTLAFAQRAKAVKNKPEINEILTESDNAKRYAQLYNEHKRKLQEQLNANKNLEREREESSKVISRLMGQIKMLENFQRGTIIEPVVNPVKRRHTIGFGRATALKAITEEVFYDFTTQDDQHWELEPENWELQTETNDTLCDVSTTPSICSTPKSLLKCRYDDLKRDYDELLSFTQHERELRESPRKNLLHLYEHHQQNTLIENGNVVSSELLEEPRYIMNELLRLKDVLLNGTSGLSNGNFNESGVEEERETMLNVFNSKIHISEEIIKNEILKQMNNFSQMNEKLNESIIVPNELASFNDLINEFSAFDTDFHNASRGEEGETIESQKLNIENLKYLRNVYESLSKKNELIGRCYKKIMLLQEKLNLNINIENLEDEDLSLIGKLQSDSRNKCSEFRQTLDDGANKDLCGKIERLQNECVSNQATIAELQVQLDQNSTKYLECHKNFLEHQQKNRDLIVEIKSLQDESVSYQFLATKYKTKFTECLPIIKQYEEENEKLTTKIKSMENEGKLSKDETLKTFDSHNAQSMYQLNLVELEKANQNLIMKIKSLEEERYANQIAMENLTAKAKEFEDEKVINKEEIDRLETLVDDYKTKYSESVDYRDKNVNLLSTIKSLEEKIVSNEEEMTRIAALAEDYRVKTEEITKSLEKEIVTREVEIEKREGLIQDLTAKVEAFESEVLSDKNTINRLETLVDDYKTKYSESVDHLDKNVNLLSTIKSLEEKIVSNEEEMSRIAALAEDYRVKTEETTKSLEKENATKQALIEEREGVIQDLTAKIEAFEKEIVNKEEIDRLKVLVNEHSKKYCECHKSLLEEREANQNLIAKINSLQMEMSSKQVAMDELKASVDEYRTKYAALVTNTRRDTNTSVKYQSEITSNQAEINKLHVLVDKYHAKYSQGTVTLLEQQEVNQELTKKIKLLEGANVTNQDVVKKLQSIADEYKGKCEQYHASVLHYEDDTRALIAKIKKLETEDASNKEVISKLKTLVNDYKRQCSEHTSSNFGEENAALHLKIKSLEELNASYLKDVEGLRKQLSWSQHLISKLDEEKEQLESRARMQNNERNQEASARNAQETIMMYRQMLNNFISYFIKEEKTFLLLGVRGEEREYMHDVRKQLKDSHVELARNFKLFQQNNLKDIKKIDELLIRSFSILKLYWDKEKDFIKEKMVELEDSNNSYVEEMAKLEQCPRCDELKQEIGNVKRQWCKDAGKAKTLEIKLEKLEEAIENKKTETMQAYEERIRHLSKEVKSLQKSAVATTKESQNAEIQCNILSVEEYEKLLKKYQVVKSVAQMRQTKIEALTDQKQ